MTERTEANISGLLAIAKSWGPWAVLVFYLLGAIPYVASPSQLTSKEHLVQSEDMRALLKATRSICYKLPEPKGIVISCE